MNEALIRSIKANPVKYAHLLGFDLLTDIHNDWMRSMLLDTDDKTLLGHRGSYKTTCLSVVLAFLVILRPDKSTFFIRKTDDDVIEIITQVQKILESDLCKYISREIYGTELMLTTASSYKVDTNLNISPRGAVQLQGMGLNGSITGKHADYVFTDDIVNVKDRVSKAEREQTKRQYMELQNIKNRGGRIYNTGTPWHKEDCIATLMPNVATYTVYDTGLISKAQQDALRKAMTPSLYAANYELQHIADVDAMFTAPHFLGDEEEAALIRQGMAHVDASYSNGGDYTAYTVMRLLTDGRIIAFGKMWQKHVDACLDAIQILHLRYGAGSIACETNGDKGYLAQEMEERGFIVRTYSEHTNKFIKISTFLRKHWDDIYWIPDTDPEYLAQILDYTEFAEHDDAPDSAASLIRELGNAPVANTAAYLMGGV